MTVFIIVNHQTSELTARAVNSIKDLNEGDWCVCIVDNSEDGGADYADLLKYLSGDPLHELPEHGDLNLVRGAFYLTSAANKGFAAANNVILNKLQKKDGWNYAFLLNSDAMMQPGSLDAIIRYFEVRPALGLCGSKVLNYPDTSTIQYLGGKYNKWTGKLKLVEAGTPDSRSELHHRHIDFPCGAAMAIRKECLRSIGLMHEHFFLYGEELHWSIHARRKKWEVDYCYASPVMHIGGSSINKEQKVSALSDYYWLRNRLMIGRIFYPHTLPVLYFFSLGFLFNRLRRKQWDRVRMYFYIIFHPANHYRDFAG